MFTFDDFILNLYKILIIKIKMTNTDATAKPKIQLDFADF